MVKKAFSPGIEQILE